MGMGDENLGDLSHLDCAVLDLTLGPFTTIKQPDISVESKRER